MKHFVVVYTVHEPMTSHHSNRSRIATNKTTVMRMRQVRQAAVRHPDLDVVACAARASTSCRQRSYEALSLSPLVTNSWRKVSPALLLRDRSVSNTLASS
jgi:hypothetical protein